MLFFLDENFPKKARLLLFEKGHECFDIRGTPQEGLEDRLIFAAAQEKRAVFLTTDRDFFHTIPFLYDKHYGVVVIALSRPNAQNILSKLSLALAFLETREIYSHCLLLTETRITFGPRTKPRI